MKKNKKILGLLTAAVLIVTAAVFGTIAYLTATSQEVKNTFTVGKVNITLDEAKVDEYGNPVSPAERVESNSYKLIPGQTYTKDPTVHLGIDSEESYVRMKVSINCQKELDRIFKGHGESGDLQQIFLGSGSKWQIVNPNPEIQGNTRTYEFRYADKVKSENQQVKDLQPLFRQIKAPEWMTAEELEALSALEIKVTADAIQAEGFADAEEAWQAFAK